jgi:hypothetical protein
MLVLQNCTSLKLVTPLPPTIVKINNPKVKSSLPPKFQDFDRRPYPHDAFILAKMIAVIKPELEADNRNLIASQISVAINKYKIAPQLMVAIIDTESDFQSDKISRTGDISIAQINVKMWNKEFVRMKRPLLSKTRIKNDQQYAVMVMAEILNLLKTRYEKRDRRWYARYHSNSYKNKSNYLHKLEVRLRALALASELSTKVAAHNPSL